MQAELDVLKRALARTPDFSIDEKNWNRLKSAAKFVRKLLYRKREFIERARL